MEGEVKRRTSIPATETGQGSPMPRRDDPSGREINHGHVSTLYYRKSHSLCRPASPGAIIAKAITDSGRDAEWLRGQLGWKKRFFADVLADRECLGILEAIAIGRVLGRADLKLISAACECERWDEEEAEMAKERR